MVANKKKLLVALVFIAIAAVVAITVAFLLGVFPSGQVSLDDAGQLPLFSENPASAETKAIPKVENATVTGPTKFESVDDEQRYKNGEWHYPGELRSKYSFTFVKPPDQPKYIAGELIAEFDVDASDDYIKNTAAMIGASSISRTTRLKSLGYCLVTFIFSDDTDVPKLAEELKGYPGVNSFEANYPFEGLDDFSSGNDPLMSSQAYLASSGFQNAWEVVTCEREVAVAVIDSGIDADHADLVANVDLLPYRDFTIGGTASFVAAEDPYGHGTIVSGILGAVSGNEVGISGASHNARVVPIRVIDANNHGDIDYVASAIDYLLLSGNVPDVINMSIGCEYCPSSLRKAINTCVDGYNIVCVAAAGNESKYDSTGKADSFVYPAACSNVISVASVDSANRRASTSRVNSSVDICAQGVKTFSTTNPSAKLSGGELYGDTLITSDGKTRDLSGTSFAAPQVAAAAALLKAQNPDWKVSQIEKRLEDTATDLGKSGRDDLYGYGLLNAAKAVGYNGPGASSSPFTGTNDGTMAITQQQADAHASLQATEQKDIPATLARLMAANQDICAWVRVEGTNVNLPIARRADNYYLDHGPEDDENPLGCPYLSSASGDFDDAVTVVYGHSFTSDVDYAFNQLHLFEDYGFFSNHDFVSVYLPGRKLEYEVIGAYLYTSRSIESVGWGDGASLDEYFGELNDMSSSTFIGYKRRIELDSDSDCVLQLSTCTIPANENLRYVVTCRYVCEEPLE